MEGENLSGAPVLCSYDRGRSALRFAIYLLNLPDSQATAVVALDGAQVKVGTDEIFPVSRFLKDMGWQKIKQLEPREWQGRYEKDGKSLEIHSRSGVGDVVATVGQKRVRAECKKGPLDRDPANREYRLLREAIGQIVTLEQVDANDVMVVAAPRSDRNNFQRLVMNWRERPLIKLTKVQLVLVGRDGSVEGRNLND